MEAITHWNSKTSHSLLLLWMNLHMYAGLFWLLDITGVGVIVLGNVQSIINELM